MSISPFKTTLTNILLPNPVFSTDSLGGLAALSQISPGSFDSTRSTLNEALAFGPGAPQSFSLGASLFGSDLFAALPAIPTNPPLTESPLPVVDTFPDLPALQEGDDPEEEENDQGENLRFARHPLGGPPGQVKKQGEGHGNNSQGSGNPGNGNGRLNRKGDF